jgi:MFS family permease
MGVAFARSIHELMIWRFFQTFGASPPLAVGAGVIGDIYRLEQRGTATGTFLMVSLSVTSKGPER